MRWLLDTNVVFSALLWRGAAYGLLQDLLNRNDVRLFTSTTLIEELHAVLLRPSAAKQLALIGQSATQIVTDYVHIVEIVAPADLPAGSTPPRRVPTDADDDHVVAAALAARVDAIITGDQDLLRVGSFDTVVVLTIGEARKRLRHD